jgi:hypothetical protein
MSGNKKKEIQNFNIVQKKQQFEAYDDDMLRPDGMFKDNGKLEI